MSKITDELPPLRSDKMPHYWVREDFEHLVSVATEMGFHGSLTRVSNTTEEAVQELKLRGLQADGFLLTRMTEKGIVDPRRGTSVYLTNDGVVSEPTTRILSWTKETIDAAAEWLYEHDYWTPWTHFCWVSNLRFGQVVQAHRLACARYGLGFRRGFDIPGFLTIIEPAVDATKNFATVRFYPNTMKAEVK